MKITILDDNKYLSKEGKQSIKKNALKILNSMEQKKDTVLSISFIDDPGIRELNKSYRNIDRATDILCFPQDGPDFSILGDIVISVDTAKRHAEKYGNSFEHEINKLLIHGILHLLGYDHKKKKETAAMREKEKELLAQIQSQD